MFICSLGMNRRTIFRYFTTSCYFIRHLFDAFSHELLCRFQIIQRLWAANRDALIATPPRLHALHKSHLLSFETKQHFNRLVSSCVCIIASRQLEETLQRDFNETDASFSGSDVLASSSSLLICEGGG